MQSAFDKDSNSCMARQTCSLRLLVKAYDSQKRILIQSFFGCCEFQALLQRDVALKIELDGNGALILALALKCWTKKAYRTKKARHVMSLIFFDYICTSVNQTMPGASHIGPLLSGAAGEKHTGHTGSIDFRCQFPAA